MSFKGKLNIKTVSLKGGIMFKEFCVGLALGLSLGMLVATNSDKIKKAVKDGEKKITKKVKEIKQKSTGDSVDTELDAQTE